MIIVPVLFIELLGLLFSSALFVLTFLTLSYIYKTLYSPRFNFKLVMFFLY